MYRFQKSDDPEFLRRAINFLQSVLSQHGIPETKAVLPHFVPSVVFLIRDVWSETSTYSACIKAGVHECHSNRGGAISIGDGNGRKVGIKPSECIIDEMVPNPHLQADESTEQLG